MAPPTTDFDGSTTRDQACEKLEKVNRGQLPNGFGMTPIPNLVVGNSLEFGLAKGSKTGWSSKNNVETGLNFPARSDQIVPLQVIVLASQPDLWQRWF
jgi:hypothetical protein